MQQSPTPLTPTAKQCRILKQLRKCGRLKSLNMPIATTTAHIRPLQTQDIVDVLTVQSRAYPVHLLENADFFLNRLALSPSTCWSARDTHSGQMLGYLIAYPWTAGLPPSLNTPIQCLPAQASHWFLHDCAIVPFAQGQKVGQALYQTGITHAQTLGLHTASLVSLATAVGYWQKLGFMPPSQPHPELHSKLADYGVDARYLQRSLLPGT